MGLSERDGPLNADRLLQVERERDVIPLIKSVMDSQYRCQFLPLQPQLMNHAGQHTVVVVNPSLLWCVKCKLKIDNRGDDMIMSRSLCCFYSHTSFL